MNGITKALINASGALMKIARGIYCLIFGIKMLALSTKPMLSKLGTEGPAMTLNDHQRITPPKRSGLEALIKSRAHISRTTKGVGNSPDEGSSDLGTVGTQGWQE